MNASQRILVVEDERVVARDLQRSLIDLGYQVPNTASTSEQALRLVSDHCPDLVLMDIRLKGQRDGIETAALLRAEYAVPVVYLTAYADAATVERAKATRPLAYLLKPVRPDELRSTVELALYRHEMEQKLQEREHWLSTTLSSIGDAVLSTDAQGNINYLNPSAEALTGVRLGDVLGRSCEQVLTLVDEQSREPLANPLRRALSDLSVVHVQGAMVRPDGTEYLFSDSTSPIVDERGRVLGAVMVFRDSSEQKRLQRRLGLADPLVSVATLARGIAHEVNNPLAFIVANLSFALDEIRRYQAEMPSPSQAPSVVWSAEVETALVEAQTGAERVTRIVAELRALTASGLEPRPAQAPENTPDAGALGPRVALRGQLPEPDSGTWLTADRSAPDLAFGQVLVVDDEPMVRAVLQRILGKQQVITAPRSSLDALALIQGGRRFDLILCDLVMPGLNGPEFYAELLRHYPDQARRVAFLTGGAVSSDSVDFLHSIANPCLDKPFIPDQLRDVVAGLLLDLGGLPRLEDAS